MRAVPFAGLAEIVRALAVLPGALGVSAATAATVVEFLPELRSEFPAAEVPALGEVDRTRRRQEALLDLIAAVAERRAISVLVDDAQHVDAQTLTVLRAIPRLREVRLLFVLAAWTPLLDGTDGVEVIDLPSLPATSIHAMLERLAQWTGAAWEDPFLDQLTATTRGLPQSVLQIVRVLVSDGVLRSEGGTWSTEDPERLLTRVSEGPSLAIDLGALTDTSRLLLRLLSVWGRPFPDLALREIARGLSVVATDEACDLALEGLESRDSSPRAPGSGPLRTTRSPPRSERPILHLIARWSAVRPFAGGSRSRAWISRSWSISPCSVRRVTTSHWRRSRSPR